MPAPAWVAGDHVAAATQGFLAWLYVAVDDMKAMSSPPGESRTWPMTPRKMFFIFDYVAANIALLVGVIWIFPVETAFGSRLFVYLLSLGIGSCAFALRWLIYMDKPQPTLQGNAFQSKLAQGNAVGLGFMAVFSLQGMSPRGLLLAALLIFVGGNCGLLLERRWERSYLMRVREAQQHVRS